MKNITLTSLVTVNSYLSPSARTMGPQIVRIQQREVRTCPVSLEDTVRPVWIAHELEQFPVFDQGIQQTFRILIVDVVISGTMDVQQVAPQILCIGDRAAGIEVLLVLLGKPHVPLLVQVVVAQLVAYGGDRDTRLIYLRVLEEQV
jgi:hypothetical protein